MKRMTDFEERLAHLVRSVEELSDIVARQERDIGTLNRRATLLLEQEAERQAGTQVPLAEEPPHW
jgi:SlyX protein